MNTVTVIRRDQIYVAKFRFDYATKDHVKAAGFQFDPKAKEWWTSKPEIARKLTPAIETTAHEAQHQPIGRLAQHKSRKGKGK